MLCLVGGQGAGKSTFFRLLAGKDEWFSDDLRKLDDENVYRSWQDPRQRVPSVFLSYLQAFCRASVEAND